MAEYSAFIELLRDVIAHGITFLEVRLDSQLVVSQLNEVYHVRHPTLLHHFLRIRLFERNFEHIVYNHIRRNQKNFIDAYANYILDRHVSHTL